MGRTRAGCLLCTGMGRLWWRTGVRRWRKQQGLALVEDRFAGKAQTTDRAMPVFELDRLFCQLGTPTCLRRLFIQNGATQLRPGASQNDDLCIIHTTSRGAAAKAAIVYR